jgi:hypothetical protein
VVLPELLDGLLATVTDLPHFFGKPGQHFRRLVVKAARPPDETGRTGDMSFFRLLPQRDEAKNHPGQ